MPRPGYQSVSLRTHEYRHLKTLATRCDISIAEMMRVAIALYEKNQQTPAVEQQDTAA